MDPMTQTHDAIVSNNEMAIDETDVVEQIVNETTPPASLSELLALTRGKCDADASLSRANALLQVIREHHYWPALQVKKFFHEPDLVLLHNTYKRVDVSHFKDLYDECRSVVLDMAAPENKNVIVTYADHIPDRLVDAQYESLMLDSDKCVECFEGTVVTVYNYKSKWYFGTSSCPSINSSRFRHPTMSHGDMLNDALSKLFEEVPMPAPEQESENDSGMMEDDEEDNAVVSKKNEVRDAFTGILEPSKAYAFVLVHHANKHAIDYTPRFGTGYAKLIHIGTRDRVSLQIDDITSKPLGRYGIEYASMFDTPQQALGCLRTQNMYGIFVTAASGKRYKVSLQSIVHKEECDLGSSNKWVNMLWVFMQNRPDYHVQNYLNEFAPDITLPLDSKGRPMSPTYLIYTCICNIRDMLYHLYCSSTVYYPAIRRFKMNKDLDKQFHPIVRFHLAQLRHVQVQHHHHAILSKRAVYHYICFHQTIKNVRALIKFFAETEGFFIPRAFECFKVLNNMLETK